MSISKALAKTASAITGFAGNLTRAVFGLDNPSASPSKKPNKKTKGSVKNTEPIDAGALSSANLVLGMIYNQLMKARQAELVQRQELQSKAEDKKKKDDEQNNEIIKALTIKRKTKKKAPVKKKEPEKKKPTEEKPPKQGEKPEAPAKPKEEPPKEPAKPKEEPPKVEKVKPEEPVAPPKPKAEELPKQPEVKPPAEKVTPKETPKPPPEKVTPRMPVGKIPPYLLEATQNKAFMSGLGVLATKYNTTEKDLLSFMMNESGLNPAAHNKNGNASGLIQIMPSTLVDMKKRNYKSVQNLNDVSDIRKLSLTEQLPLIDDYFNAQGLKKSAALAEKEGRKVDLGTLYTTVFLPIYKDKPNDYIMGIKPGVTAPNGETGDAVIAKGLTKGMVYEANAAFDLKGKKKGYFTKGDVQEKASGFSSQVDTALKTTGINQQIQEINNSADKIDQSSKENKDLKSSAEAKSQTNVNNTIVAPTSDDQTPSIPKKKIDDRPAIQRK